MNLNSSRAIADLHDTDSVIHTASIDLALEAEAVSTLQDIGNGAAISIRQRL